MFSTPTRQAAAAIEQAAASAAYLLPISGTGPDGGAASLPEERAAWARDRCALLRECLP